MTPARLLRTALRPAPLLAAWVAVASCGQPTETEVADEALQEMQADQVLYNTATRITSHGVRQALVEADSLYSFSDSSTVNLFGVAMSVYSETGQVRATVTSETGQMDRRSEKLVARGDVVLEIPGENRVIESPELHYDPSGEQIWSDSATVSREGGRVTRGSCFRSDLQFRNFTICNPRGAASVGPGGGG